MDSRIEQLREWLAERDETVIVIVGHGQFFKRCLNRGFVQANVSVLECSFSARSGFSLQAELHPAAEVAAQRVHDGGEGAAVWADTAPGDDGSTEPARDRMRDMSLLPPPLLDERLDGASGLTEVALSDEADAAAAAPAVAGAVEAGTEGEAAPDGQGATDAAARAGAGAGDVAESWWGGASLRALLPSCSVST